MKILVPLERVPDLDRADRLAVTATGDDLDLSALERQTNPFDLHALEAALRLTEDGRAPRQRLGEVVVVTLGGQSTALTQYAAYVYLIARVAYIPAYALGLTPWRSAIWGIGFAATLTMLIASLL
ncbi:MAG TPA: MAPEG family protein [Polyangiaceae bacterium]|nr:MAPEG family protein [Polyangiaceae bacterium]